VVAVVVIVGGDGGGATTVIMVDGVVVPAATDFGISLVTGTGFMVALTAGGFCRRALDVSIEILG
jgi:hypothetical protein